MRHRPVVAVVFGLLLLGIVVILSRPLAHDPADLYYWVGLAGGDKDWSSESGLDKPQAEFFHGARFLFTNFCVMGESTHWLSVVPVVGKRYWKTSYEICGPIDPEQLAQSYRWIKRSADHGFAPAKEAEKLFIGRIALPANVVGQPEDTQN